MAVALHCQGYARALVESLTLSLRAVLFASPRLLVDAAICSGQHSDEPWCFARGSLPRYIHGLVGQGYLRFLDSHGARCELLRLIKLSCASLTDNREGGFEASH